MTKLSPGGLKRSASSAIASALPAPLLMRSAALGFRLRKEQRLFFLSELVDRERVAVDAGAWLGPWSYWLAKRCPEVWAFEPNPRLADLLRSTMAKNVHVEGVALSEQPGQAELFLPAATGPDAQATLSPEHALSGASGVTVELRTLDSYAIDNVGFLKIDVENHEFALLRGGRETISSSKPVILIEIEQRFFEWPIDDVFTWIQDLGYRGWIRQEREWRSIDLFDVQRDQLDRVENVKSTSYINNFVFLPEGRTL